MISLQGKIRSTGPRLDYLPEGGLISLLDRPYLERQYADETVRIQYSLSQGESRHFFFYFLFLSLFYFLFTLRSNLAYS